jgi:hypothetical protein
MRVTWHSIVVLLICLLLSCKSSEQIWSAESHSPDGNWIASARTVEYGGFGTNSVETVIELKRTSGHFLSPIRVLGFSDDGKSMALAMAWTTPSHFEVTFRDDPKVLYYQVVKTSGIDISVRNLQDG